jgi:hypothetical protein
MLSRRSFVGKLAAGAAAACAVSSIGKAQATTTNSDTPSEHPKSQRGPVADAMASASAPPASAPQQAPPWELIRPLAMGAVVARDWRVAGLTAADHGSVVLTLQNGRGRSHRVHLCRNDGHPQGLVHTKRFDLVVMNGGEGDLPTEEGFAQAVAEVAHALAANEHAHQNAPLLASLMPHAERVERFASAAKLR